MSQNNNQKKPQSFTYLNQLEDPAFIQYLQKYYSNLAKKQRQNDEKSGQMNFFMQEQQILMSNQNAYENNLTCPSINMFQFKEYKQPMQQDYQPYQMMRCEQEEPNQQNKQPLKSQHELEEKECSKNGQNDSYVGNTQQFKKPYNPQKHKVNDQQRVKRLHLIIGEVSQIKYHIQGMLEHFVDNIRIGMGQKQEKIENIEQILGSLPEEMDLEHDWLGDSLDQIIYSQKTQHQF